MMLISLLLHSFFFIQAVKVDPNENAVVTLVTGDNGAIALGQSIKDVGSRLHRIAMVTSDVNEKSRSDLAKVWEVIEVEPVYCNHRHNLDSTAYDLKGDKYQRGLQRWSQTCTKFRAWTLTDYSRIVFMDSDMVVAENFDDALYEFTNASFAACPDPFPPDTFNSGFMVLNPSMNTFQYLLEQNEKIGSAEGGDQGVFNLGLCPNWFHAGPDDPHCGRLPWIFNVQASYYEQYKTLRDGKPWVVLAYEYHEPHLLPEVPPSTLESLAKQVSCHLLWRAAFFKATNHRPVQNNFLIKAVNFASGEESQISGKAALAEKKKSKKKKKLKEMPDRNVEL